MSSALRLTAPEPPGVVTGGLTGVVVGGLMGLTGGGFTALAGTCKHIKHMESVICQGVARYLVTLTRIDEKIKLFYYIISYIV